MSAFDDPPYDAYDAYDDFRKYALERFRDAQRLFYAPILYKPLTHSFASIASPDPKPMKKVRVTKEQKEAIEAARRVLGQLPYDGGPVNTAYCALKAAEAIVTTEPTPEEKAAERAKADYAAIEAEREKLKPAGYVEKAYPSGSTYTDQIVLAAMRVAKRELRAELANSIRSAAGKYGNVCDNIAYSIEAGGRES